jgi:hypothetical protein
MRARGPRRCPQRRFRGSCQGGARNHQRQHGAAGQPPTDYRGATPGFAQAHQAGTELRAIRGLRPRDRGGDRERGDQAQDLRAALPGPQACGSRRLQHVVDLDHPARRRDRPTGEVHRHPFHESGAGDGARRASLLPTRPSRPPRPSLPSSARLPRSPKTSRLSSSTASCCR